jgi:lycopene cyclase domain-containing protein
LSLYLIINIASVAVPLLFSFHPRLKVYQHWGKLFPGLFIAGAIFVAWDVVFTHWGVWGFNPRYINGATLFNLPIEEVLFFFCIPYACLFSYICLNQLLNLAWTDKFGTVLTWGFILLFAGIAIAFPTRLYSSVTSGAAAGFLLIHLLWFRTAWLGRFYYCWTVMLLPFFIVNGILTGSFIEEEVVWYNNAENLGLRMGTIPVEDFAYGMLLLLIAVTVYEKLNSRRERIAHAGY